MKNLDESQIKEQLLKLEAQAQQPLWHTEVPEDFQVQLRTDERVSPAMFKPDPLIPGGYIANSLTLRAMRPTLFIAGNNLDELGQQRECACGHQWDAQFWKFCPYCARS